MQDLTFRTLRADEIEVRVATIQNGKATMLLYMDSRVVVSLLNETVGAFGWQSDFKEVNGQLIGSISIWDEEKRMWITKSDTGSESNIEAQKGLVSDCYKRVLSRWGVDELYSAPRIIIDDDGYKCTGYKVSEIEYDNNRNISHLIIVNKFGKEAFRWDKGSCNDQKTAPPAMTKKPVMTTATAMPSRTKLNVEECANIINECEIKAHASGKYDEDSLRRFFYGKLKWIEENEGFSGDLKTWLQNKFREKFAA